MPKCRATNCTPSPNTPCRYITPILWITLAAIMLFSCDRPEVISDLEGHSFQMLDQDSAQVTFPEAFEGELTVVGFIYTHCPDICSAITANMSNVYRQLENREDVRFVGITFDPERDRPSVLKTYMTQFRLDPDRFTFLTGNPETVDSLLTVMDIQTRISSRREGKNGEQNYLMSHTNRISLIDRESRLRVEYSGSFSKPEHIVEDINKLR